MQACTHNPNIRLVAFSRNESIFTFIFVSPNDINKPKLKIYHTNKTFFRLKIAKNVPFIVSEAIK